jgi:LexA DNA binding domain
MADLVAGPVVLTDRQRDTLKVLCEDPTPTLRELALRLGVSSTHTAWGHVAALRRAGLVEGDQGRHRAMRPLPRGRLLVRTWAMDALQERIMALQEGGDPQLALVLAQERAEGEWQEPRRSLAIAQVLVLAEGQHAWRTMERYCCLALYGPHTPETMIASLRVILARAQSHLESP